MPIRLRSSFRVLGATRTQDQRRCVLVLPGLAANHRQVAETFRQIAHLQGMVNHPIVAKVERFSADPVGPLLDFDFDGVIDGHDATLLIAGSDRKIPYGAADGFIVELRKGLEASHAVRHPQTGGPLCIGRISAHNIVFNASGQWQWIGLGRNFAVEKEDGSIDVGVRVFQANELIAGAPPSPTADYVALVLFMRSMLPHADMSGVLERVLRSEAQPEDRELIDCLQWVEHRVLGELPALRPSIAEAVVMAERIRELLGISCDPRGFSQMISELLAIYGTPQKVPAGATETRELRVGPNGCWVEGPAGRQRLGHAAARIVEALVQRHRDGDHRALTLWDILEAGWPGEQPVYEAATNRVYVTLTRLRRAAMGPLLERHDDGWRLLPTARIRRATGV